MSVSWCGLMTSSTCAVMRRPIRMMTRLSKRFRDGQARQTLRHAPHVLLNDRQSIHSGFLPV